MKRTTLRFKRGACLLYTGAMILTSVIPMETRTDSAPFWAAMDPSFQNFLHIPIFMAFTFLFLMAYPMAPERRAAGLALVLGAGALLSVLTEAIQIVVPGRYPSWGDIALNLIGAALGGLVLLSKRLRPQLK